MSRLSYVSPYSSSPASAAATDFRLSLVLHSVFAALAFAASAVAVSNLQVPSSATPDNNVTITWTSDSSDPSPLTLALFSADNNQTFAGGLAIANDVNVGQNQITILFPQLVSPGCVFRFLFLASSSSSRFLPLSFPSPRCSPSFFVHPSIHPSRPVPILPSIHPSLHACMRAPPPSPPSRPSPLFPPPLRLMIPMLPSSSVTPPPDLSPTFITSIVSLYFHPSIYFYFY
ncbi:hypothetical protein R3P38DRAFT_3532210 [Favolaschia claudopus]|uniref:Uncharacterized protein n=1 Tax=Favolaschia claudopus TaxID=2862362 RepID=A0AAW0BEK2_9AGAR